MVRFWCDQAKRPHANARKAKRWKWHAISAHARQCSCESARKSRNSTAYLGEGWSQKHMETYRNTTPSLFSILLTNTFFRCPHLHLAWFGLSTFVLKRTGMAIAVCWRQLQLNVYCERPRCLSTSNHIQNEEMTAMLPWHFWSRCRESGITVRVSLNRQGVDVLKRNDSTTQQSCIQHFHLLLDVCLSRRNLRKKRPISRSWNLSGICGKKRIKRIREASALNARKKGRSHVFSAQKKDR